MQVGVRIAMSGRKVWKRSDNGLNDCPTRSTCSRRSGLIALEIQFAMSDSLGGHSFKMFKKRYRLDVRKFKFASMVCQESGTGWGMGL